MMAEDTTKKQEELSADDALDKLLNDAPPDPRGASKSTPDAKHAKPADAEDRAVAQIEEADKRDAVDELYEEESEPEAPMVVLGEEKHPRLAKLKKPKFWILLSLALVVMAVFAWLITPSRTWILNTLGQRATLNISTLVATTEGTPPILKNATVTVNGAGYHTGEEGTLRVTLPYGPVHIVVSKQGYESITKDQTLDFDPFFYKLGGKAADDSLSNLKFNLKNIGVLVTFTAKEWLTGNPVTRGTFSVGDVAALPGTDGVVTLALPSTDANTVQVTAKFKSDYADTTLEVPVGAAKPDVLLLPAGKDYFLSKRSGQFGAYKSNLDGSGTAELVPPANETGDVMLSVSPSQKYAVLASTREGTRDTFGSIQQKLYLVDLASNKMTALDTALVFRIADWSGDTVVYTAEYHDAAGNRMQRLSSFDTTTNAQLVLTTANGFTVVRVRLGSAVYRINSGELRTVKAKGGTEKTIGTETDNLTQVDPNHLAFQTADKAWHQYDINADQLSNIPTPPTISRAFLASPSADGQMQLAIDTIDGRPTLIAKNVGSGKETTLYTGADLSGPIRWVGNVVIYRAGSADYVVSPSGGAPKKITDVSPTISVNNDYYTFN